MCCTNGGDRNCSCWPWTLRRQVTVTHRCNLKSTGQWHPWDSLAIPYPFSNRVLSTIRCSVLSHSSPSIRQWVEALQLHIISQLDVLEVLQKLENSTEKVTSFHWQYGGGADRLLELLFAHMKERGLGGEDFEMVFLTSGEEKFNGLAILYNGTRGESLTVWGMESQGMSHSFTAKFTISTIESHCLCFMYWALESHLT